MSLESFYGGKPGVSPVVRARFKYVSENDPAYITAMAKASSDDVKAKINNDTMEICFAKIDYEDVWYGQMAIIDTTNKRNPNNGKLFRRVLTRSQDEAAIDGGTIHGEYIGRIVGPSEGYPKIRLGSLEQLTTQISTEQDNISADFESNGKKLAGIEYSFPSGAGIVDVDSIVDVSPETLIATKANNQLIPGAVKNDQNIDYETGIHYSWVNVRNNIDGVDQETYIYLGFQIPYTYFDFDIKQTDWFNDFKTNWRNQTKYENGEQPFYQKREILIPRGTQGNHIGALRRVKASDFINFNSKATEILYPFEDLYNDKNGKFEPRDYNESYPQFETENITADTSILVYTYYMYDENYEISQGETPTKINKCKIVTCYLSKIIDIEDIQLQDNGDLIITYSSGAQETLNKIKWIDNVEMFSSRDEENNEENINNILDSIKLIYNTGEELNLNKDRKLRFLEYIRLNENEEKTFQNLLIKYTDRSREEDLPGFNFFQIDGLLIDPNTKELKYHTNPKNAILNANINDYKSFNTPTYLNVIDNVFLDEDGDLYIKYSSSEKRYTGTNIDYSEEYKPYVRDIYTDENGVVWKRGGAFPDAIVQSGETEQTARLRWFWWMDLGKVEKKFSGVRIASELNIERYEAYYEYINLGQHYDWDALKNATEVNQITTVENILNTPWTIDNRDVSPYVNGNIYIYEQNKNTDFNSFSFAENRIGQLVYFEEHAYYYDANTAKWKCAGSWSSSDSTMQIRVQTGLNTFVPNDIDSHTKGFTMGLSDIDSSWELNWSNIWKTT